MALSKNQKILAIVLVLAVGGYLAFRWYSRKMATQGGAPNDGSISSGTGSNLNSVAPDLVGGSSVGGTDVGPGANIPVNINITTNNPPSGPGGANMQGMLASGQNPLTSMAVTGAGSAGVLVPGDTSPGTATMGPTSATDPGDGIMPQSTGTPAGTSAGSGSGTTAQTAPPSSSASVAVPNVVGQRANTGITALKNAGFGYRSTTGARNPAYTYSISSESPTKAPKGSVIDLAFKQN